MKQNLIFIAFLCLVTSCKKEYLYDKASGIYETDCRLVQYQIGQNGYSDSTVYNRKFLTEIEIRDNGDYTDLELALEQPNVYEWLSKVESYKENIARYENYLDRSPDGDPDTLSVEINTETLAIEIFHVGHSKFLFPPDAPFSIVDYREVCRGFKVQ